MERDDSGGAAEVLVRPECATAFARFANELAMAAMEERASSGCVSDGGLLQARAGQRW